MRTSVQRGGLGLTGILLVVVALVALSGRTGGPVSWYVTNGISMLPTISKGTLVVVHRKPVYEVGDVVAYHSRDLGQTVLHRVTGFDGDRLVMKGDNNDFLDPEQPLPSEALGARAFQVPGVGPALSWLQQPWVLAIGAVVIAEALLRTPTRRRRQRRGATTGYTDPSAAEPPEQAAAAQAGALRAGAVQAAEQVRGRLASFDPTQLPSGVETGLKVAVGSGLVLALLCTAGPFLKAADPAGEAAQRIVTWSYGGKATAGLAYPQGEVKTDDVLYPKLLDSAEVTAELSLDLPDDAAVSGTWRLQVGVGNAKGWSRTTSAGSPTPFTSAPQQLTARVPIAELLALQQQLDAETGVTSGQLEIKVTAIVDLEIAQAGEVDQLTGTSVLSFLGTPTEVARDPESPLRQEQPLELGEATERRQLVLLGVSLPTGPTRTAALAIALLSGLALSGLSAGRRFEDEDARILRTVPERLVPADPSADPDQVVDVDSFAKLLGIAERYDRVILFADVQGLRFYFVLDDGIAYRYYSEKNAARLDGDRAALSPARLQDVEPAVLPPIPQQRGSESSGLLQ